MADFGGDRKVGRSLLYTFEQWLIARCVAKIPSWLETYHLTLLTLLWAIAVLAFSYLAGGDIRWLWLVSAAIVLQYVTDLFDGAVGRYRKTGLVKWGFYMDHFLDYVFLCSILIGYSFVLPKIHRYSLFFILAIFGGYMVNSFLSFAATNQFRIAYLGIGPTEIRILFIAINTLIILFGRTYLAYALTPTLIISFLGLCILVYKTQKELWKTDMGHKHAHK